MIKKILFAFTTMEIFSVAKQDNNGSNAIRVKDGFTRHAVPLRMVLITHITVIFVFKL